MAKLRLLDVQDGLIPNPSLTGNGFILHPQSHAVKGDKTQSSKMGFDPSAVTQHHRGEAIKKKAIMRQEWTLK